MNMMNLSFYDALRVVEEVPSIGRAAGKINDFVSFIQGLKSKAVAYTVRETLEEVIELTGYVKELEAEKTEEAQARIENIDELISKTESLPGSHGGGRTAGNTFCRRRSHWWQISILLIRIRIMCC